MKRISFIFFVASLILTSICDAETILVGPKGAGASATIALRASLSVAVKNRSNNSAATSVGFGNVPMGTGGKVAPQYLEVTYACNYGPNPPVWGIDLYTKNVGAYPGFAKGGLIHNSSKSVRVVMCYAAFDNLQPSLTDPSGPPRSDPWIYIVDKNDTDDPATPDRTDWSYLLQINYPRFVYGFGNGDSFLQMGGPRCTSPVYVYPAGLFGGCPAGTYGTALYVDLYHL